MKMNDYSFNLGRDREVNLSSRLKQTALENADKIAYYFMDEATTYSQFDSAVTKFASGLERIGIRKGDHVGLILGNTPHFIIGLYGALRAGATVIPINPIYTPDEIRYMLDNGDVKVVITLDKLYPVIQQLESKLPKVEQYIFCEMDKSEQNLAFRSRENMKSFTDILGIGTLEYDSPSLDQDDVAVILYTSGTTGNPKGAMLTHKNLYSNASDIGDYLKMNADDKVITTLPMFHVFSLSVVVNAPLISGATIIVVPKFSPKEIFRLVKKYDATIFAGVPTMFNFLYQYPEGKPDDLKSLRLAISGGSSMPVALLKDFERKFNVIISEGYGLSEASPVTCFNPLDRPRKPGSIGTNIRNVVNKVVNEHGEEVPVGEVGELVVQGPNVMKGYYKLPEETAATIRDGWLYTGDLARMDEDGYFYLVDRKKDMIIVGGYNVYPREIEEVLYNHPDIIETTVIGVPDKDHGEAVKAFVVSKNPDLTEEQLLEYCKQYLAKYKIPSSIEFLDELPKNTTGKILRRALKEQVLQRK